MISNRKKAVLFGLSLLLVVVFLFAYNREIFDGDKIKNHDYYALKIKKMNGTDSHAMNLAEGTVLEVNFVTEEGCLCLKIKAPDGTSIYQGNGKALSAFEVKAKAAGIYTIVVQAHHAKGKIVIQKKGV